MVFNNSFIIQYGTSTGSANVVFNVSFTKNYSVSCCTITTVGGTGNTGMISTYKSTLSNCYIYVRNVGDPFPYTNDKITYIAIGY